MKILDFGFTLLDKFSPMQETDISDLRMDAANDYSKVKNTFFDSDKKQLKEGQELKDLNIKQKIVYYSEQWPVRLGLAFLFIILTPLIQNWLDPVREMPEDLEELDD